MIASSLYFHETEFIHSRIAEDLKIDNTPTDRIKIHLLATMLSMDRIRAFLGFPVTVISGYRCELLNKAVHGSEKSQHMEGLACDFICPKYGDPRFIASVLLSHMEEFRIDQMIMEGTWVHVSFTSNPRNQVLSFRDGKYWPGIV